MPYQHLNAAERQVIQRAHAAGESFTAIAKTLGGSASTVSNEWHRNPCSGCYQAGQAQHKAECRSSTPRHQRRQNHRALQAAVLLGLSREWSPKIISARLRLDYPNTPHMRISAETIYQCVYRDAAHGGQLYRQLWQRRPHRRRRHDRLIVSTSPT
jgi:IS30 family transposase